MKKIVFIHK